MAALQVMIVVDAATGLVLLALGLANRRARLGCCCWPPGWPGSLATSRPGRSICTAGRLFTSFWPTRSCVLAPAWRGPPLPLVTCAPCCLRSPPVSRPPWPSPWRSCCLPYTATLSPRVLSAERGPLRWARRPRSPLPCRLVRRCGWPGCPPAKPPNSSTICSSRGWRPGSRRSALGSLGQGRRHRPGR